MRVLFVCNKQKKPPLLKGRWTPKAAGGILTGLALRAVTPAAGQESLRLAYARHLPLTREAFRQSAPTTSERRLPCPKHLNFLHSKNL